MKMQMLVSGWMWYLGVSGNSLLVASLFLVKQEARSSAENEDGEEGIDGF